jgi:formyl-CoA transferase
MIQEFDVADGGGPDARVLEDVAFPGITPVLGDTGLPVRWLGPDLGADTADALAEAGLAPELITRLLVAGGLAAETDAGLETTTDEEQA